MGVLVLRSSVASGGGGDGPTYFAAIAADGGSASNSGTELSPWTPDYALTRLVAGDTLRVKGAGPFIWAGSTTYEGAAFNPTNSGTSSAPITIISHVPRQAVIRSPDPGQTPAIGLVRKNYIHVKNFTVFGQVKARGNADNDLGGTPGNNPNMMRGIVFEGLDVHEGDIEGGDTSLKWGICFQWIRESYVRHCRVWNLISAYQDAENTSGIGIFDSTDNIFEFNWVDATNVHAGIGFKAGRTNRNIIRYNYVQNARSGFDGAYGVGIYFKANTAYDTSPRPSEDNDAYGNIIVNAYSAFHDNHGMFRTRVYNNTVYQCDRFYNQGFNSNRDARIYNNIANGDGSMMAYLLEFLGGTNPDMSTYIDMADRNCWYNMGAGGTNVAHAYHNFGASSISLSNFRSLQTGITGRDQNSIQSNPLLVDAAGGDFRLQAGSPCIGTGEGGVDMGAYGMATRVGPDWV